MSSRGRHLQAPVQYAPFLDERPLGSVAAWHESLLATTLGAVSAGTANSDVLDSLVDGSASFTTTVATGFIVHNTTDNIFAKVVSVTNNSTLVLNYDAFPDGNEDYAVYPIPALQDGWARMDGQTIVDPESPFNGKIIPDWNGDKRFLRGGDVSGIEELDQFQGHHHDITAHTSAPSTGYGLPNPNSAHGTAESTIDSLGWSVTSPISDGVNGTPRTGDETRPINASVIWIFKYKAPRVATAGKLSVEDLTVTGTINGSSTITSINNDYVVSAAERIIYANPIDNDIDISIPTDYPIGFPLKVVNNYNGYGMVVDGDCESATSPSFTGGASPSPTNATWAQDTGDSFKGSSSYKLTVTTGGSEGYISLTGPTDTGNLRGFVAGETYTIQAALKSGTTSAAGEASIRFYYYDNSSWHYESSTSSLLNEWQIISITKTIPSTTTGVIVRVMISDAASSGEYILADEIKAWRHHLTRIMPPSGNIIGNGTYLGMSNQSAKAEVSKYDSENFSIESFSGLSGNVRMSSSPLTVTHNFGSSNYTVDVSPVSNEAGFLGEFGATNFTPTTFQIYYTGSSDTVDMGWYLRPI